MYSKLYFHQTNLIGFLVFTTWEKITMRLIFVWWWIYLIIVFFVESLDFAIVIGAIMIFGGSKSFFNNFCFVKDSGFFCTV